MSDGPGRSRVTVTLGNGGRVVKRAEGFVDEGILNGVPNTPSKRSIRDRLGGSYEDRSEPFNKRKCGKSTSNSIDTCLRKDDLRFKLMHKDMGQKSQNNESLHNIDLRDKLSSKTYRPFLDTMTMRPPESATLRHFMHDPMIAGVTRQPVLESRDTSILGQFPPSRNPNEFSAIGHPRSYSSWTLENLRRRSPVGLRQRSPLGLRQRSPEILIRKSPVGFRQRSPEGLRQRLPVGLRQRSPVGLRQRSPKILMRRSPVSLRQISPVGLRQRSPVDLRQRSPVDLRQRSSVGLRRRSPVGLRQRSPVGLRRRSPVGLRRRSPVGFRQRSPVGFRQRSPEIMKQRSPEDLKRRSPEEFRRRSPEGLRRRSPERPFRPTAVRGLSPRSRDDLQRRTLIRPYDDRRSPPYARLSPRRAAQSPPYLSRSSVPAPPIKSTGPVSRYPQASRIIQRNPSPLGAALTVDSFLQSLGLEKYTIFFKAEEIDMNALSQLGDSDLRGLGIPMGPRRMILEALMPRPRR